MKIRLYLVTVNKNRVKLKIIRKAIDMETIVHLP